MSATTRCAELGITLPPVAAPVADYVPAIQTGSQILTSGQLPFVDGELTAVGKVGDAVSAEQAAEAARAAALTAIAAAADVAGGLDAIKRIVRVVVFVNSAPDFTGQAGVANGASQLLGQVFGEHGRHARSAVGVATLPLGSAVEVELTVEVSSRRFQINTVGARCQRLVPTLVDVRCRELSWPVMPAAPAP